MINKVQGTANKHSIRANYFFCNTDKICNLEGGSHSFAIRVLYLDIGSGNHGFRLFSLVLFSVNGSVFAVE